MVLSGSTILASPLNRKNQPQINEMNADKNKAKIIERFLPCFFVVGPSPLDRATPNKILFLAGDHGKKSASDSALVFESKSKKVA